MISDKNSHCYIFQVGLVAFSEVVRTPPGCYSEELAFATDGNKDVFYQYLDGIQARGGTDYVKALEKAFQLLKKSAILESDNTRRMYR